MYPCFRSALLCSFPCPERSNPAEHLADLVAVDHSSPEEEAASSERVEGLIRRFQQLHPAPTGIGAAVAHTGQNGHAGDKPGKKGVQHRPRKLGFLEMFKLLFSRAWKQVRCRSVLLLYAAV